MGHRRSNADGPMALTARRETVEEQTTDQRRRQADRIDTITLVVGIALTLGIATWRVPQMAEAHIAPAPTAPVVVEQGRAG